MCEDYDVTLDGLLRLSIEDVLRLRLRKFPLRVLAGGVIYELFPKSIVICVEKKAIVEFGLVTKPIDGKTLVVKAEYEEG